ncbi:9-O-acetylesterase [Neptunitalea chrysea]|uniref:9-O-acetylesterase n=2 Tax=Neptunitalea chrysea TaxID=1647581 RepID=A0A9W6ETF1_9FLAO|nr:9-O-acetylesterase [Neptunitalea chrysea]
MYAQINLPKLITNGMVLQRNAEVRIWGWASPGEKVTVTFQQQHQTVITNEDRNWSVKFSDLTVGGPYNMVVQGTNTINLKDVYVGDVYLCSGQSNMELPMYRVAPKYPGEIEQANNLSIRYFKVPKEYTLEGRQNDISGGSWLPVTPENLSDFSAVAYFYAKNLHNTYNIPIGIIDASLGGSPVQAWISEEYLKDFPTYVKDIEPLKIKGAIQRLEQEDQERIKEWYQTTYIGDALNEKKGRFGVLDWEKIHVPGFWKQTLGDIHGVVWYQKKFMLEKKDDGKEAKLLLGRIVDADSVFVNGVFVGNTTYQYPPRRYQIPSGILKEGENTLVVKVINERGDGGFITDKPYQLNTADTEIDLSGIWYCKIGTIMPALQPQRFFRWKPTGLYNAMIHPLSNYSINGVLWYQGESNTNNPNEYKELFETLIQCWRKQWNSNIPFLYVQLANFMEPSKVPTDSNWARLREAQLQTLELPNTAMVVTIDVGEWNDIHPLDKKTVGDRLANAAECLVYHEKQVVGGPIYKSFKIQDDAIILSFNQTGSGLMVKNGQELGEFSIAGSDGIFYWAHAIIDGNTVIVSSKEVSSPVAVRYAWSNNPVHANLYNKEEFPASPFRTDNW